MDKLMVKRLVCEPHHQWYDDAGILHTFVCVTYYEKDDEYSMPIIIGKCVKCHDIDKLTEVTKP